MTYIYDILLNFNRDLYEVYEWNRNDNITHIRKIPLFRISSKSLFDIINNKVKFDNDFLTTIYKRTEVFVKNKVNNIDYSLLITNGKEVVALKCSNDSVIEYSKLLYEEEIEVLEYSEGLKTSEIKYEFISKNNINPFKTRNENNIRKYIFKELNQMIKDNEEDKLKYIYLECFNKNVDGDLKKQIYIDLEKNWDDIYLKLYDFLKRILIKH